MQWPGTVMVNEKPRRCWRRGFFDGPENRVAMMEESAMMAVRKLIAM